MTDRLTASGILQNDEHCHGTEVHAIWDDVARVWVAASDDVPGLATEADDMEALVTKLKSMIPELLDANAIPHGAQVPFEILGQRFAVADPEAA